MAKPAGDTAPIVRIFLSSPIDVAEERKIARELIEGELQKHPSYRHLKLEVIAWDDPDARIPLLANETPQESVNNARPRPATCHIVIVILWARMGTPLPETICKPDGERYLSGTEWEYLDAINSTWERKPDVLVYRRTEKPQVDLDDEDYADKLAQYKLVKAFFAQFRNADGALKQGANECPTSNNFKELLQQHLADLLHRRFPAPPAGGTPHSVAATIPDAYLEWLRRECADVSLLGQERQQGQALTLSHVYVPAIARLVRMQYNMLDASTTEETYGFPYFDELEYSTESPTKLFPLLDFLSQFSLYVPAPAGAGKSTFCRWAVLQSIAAAEVTHPVPAPAEFGETVPTDLRRRLPLLIPLREFWPKMKCGRGERAWCRAELEDALAAWVDRSLADRLTGENLLAHLRAGSVFLLLDGLDEVPVTDTRDGATVYPRDLLLTGLADALPVWLKAGNRVLLTSRPYGLDEEGLRKLGLPRAPLEPLLEPLQDLFVARWFHALGKPWQTKGLIATIRDHEREYLPPLAENPMMLTALCVLYDSGGRLPEDRHDLYRRIVDNVLYRRYPGEASQREPISGRLQVIALGMHTGECADAPRRTPAAEISWVETELLISRFAELNPAYEKDHVEAAVRREDLLNRSGLLVPRGNERAAFYHMSFQEFLAAQRLARMPGNAAQIFRERWDVAEWRSTLLFLFARHVDIWGAQSGISFLAQLISGLDRAAVKTEPAPAVFIAEALDLCLAKNYALSEELKEKFRRLALDAIEDEAELQARQAMGLTLGRIGDPRIFDLRDAHGYVEVPAGRYPYGDEGRTVEIRTPFRIGRFPVTNQQYATFIAAEGYSERRWWSQEGWAWLGKAKVSKPAYWDDRIDRNAGLTRRWNQPNQPVVGVSFWEAEACSRWAGGRLPSEEEWEAAARGSNGLTFPWGNEWQDGICNTAEASLGVTTPVGLFPRSRQADLAIEDLAGNVWEWCNSLYGLQVEELADLHVIRGGALYDEHDQARSTNRGSNRPYTQFHTIGFRVMRSSPSSDADQ